MKGGIAADVLHDEIVKSKWDIERHTGRDVTLFCYPNGEITSEAANLVRDNYGGACTTRSGWNSRSNDNHALLRLGLHEDISSNVHYFLARLSGWV
jgi:hypothetical protein